MAPWHPVAAPDDGDDFVWIGGPGERVRLVIVLFEEASADIGMLMGGVIVDDGVDRLARGDLLLDDIEEASELLAFRARVAQQAP